ncbi:hypothetical protein PIB30_033773 [Stylosanthes scabra]|uniref:Uncharacterized protein n=1 Tax=Stylosanthes scabra TaxID=79078 RepID=A0ABU6TCA9_9FABA|nr:hypothetical protein [Stylosanthes scabra]
MAGLFSLGPQHHSKQEQQDQEEHNHNHNNNNIQLLFRNEEIYTTNTNTANRGFEIWPHQPSYYSFGLGPANNRNSNTNLNDDVSVSFSDDSANRFGFTVMRSSSSGSALGTGTNCQDCGNQAKKDCPHLRCRTCCRSRGFQCSTHVKSTWVPAAKRRERQQTLASLQQQGHHHRQDHEELGGGDGLSRRTRDAAVGATSSACVPVPITTTGLELGQFPPELNSPAVFRCVKVSPMDAPDDRYAYQTAVNIGGHVFKGILYDQGPDSPFATNAAAGEGSSHGGGEAHHQQLSLITTTATTTTGGGITFDPSQLYPAPMNAFMAGTQFFPPPRT